MVGREVATLGLVGRRNELAQPLFLRGEFGLLAEGEEGVGVG
jgi:hypothetical protein